MAKQEDRRGLKQSQIFLSRRLQENLTEKATQHQFMSKRVAIAFSMSGRLPLPFPFGFSSPRDGFFRRVTRANTQVLISLWTHAKGLLSTREGQRGIVEKRSHNHQTTLAAETLYLMYCMKSAENAPQQALSHPTSRCVFCNIVPYKGRQLCQFGPLFWH